MIQKPKAQPAQMSRMSNPRILRIQVESVIQEIPQAKPPQRNRHDTVQLNLGRGEQTRRRRRHAHNRTTEPETLLLINSPRRRLLHGVVPLHEEKRRPRNPGSDDEPEEPQRIDTRRLRDEIGQEVERQHVRAQMPDLRVCEGGRERRPPAALVDDAVVVYGPVLVPVDDHGWVALAGLLGCVGGVAPDADVDGDEAVYEVGVWAGEVVDSDLLDGVVGKVVEDRGRFFGHGLPRAWGRGRDGLLGGLLWHWGSDIFLIALFG